MESAIGLSSSCELSLKPKKTNLSRIEMLSASDKVQISRLTSRQHEHIVHFSLYKCCRCGWRQSLILVVKNNYLS